MLFGRSIHFTTSQSREAVVARLSAAILPVRAIGSRAPVRVNDWIAQIEGKRFVGRFDGSRFKLGLLQTPGARIKQRGNAVIIVGSVEDQAVQARLRPPLFVLAVMAAFVVLVAMVLVLSFFGPVQMPTVQAALALCVVFPVALIVWFFRREAAEVEQALRQTILDV